MNECIVPTELSEFVLGRLNPQRLDTIAAHLDTCGKCQDTVIALADRSDTLVVGLRASRQTAEGPFQGESALMTGLRRIVSVVKRPASRESLSFSPDDIGPLSSVGPYKIESRLGIGGMGAVFKATHAKLKRTVALKMLPEGRWPQAEVIARFEREMEAIGQLDHPHIVRATDAGQDNGLHYLVMEFVDGIDLARMVQRLGALPVPEACELIRQAAVGLHYAHEHGLIHRDIKPSNLMLGWQAKDGVKKSSQPTVKVLDMGLALLGDEHFQRENELTTIGQLMGTLDYMSPEQGMDSHDVTATSDIFSLGATLYKLLTGKSPLDAMNVTTPLRKITTLATKDLPSIAEQRPDLPPTLVRLVDGMLAREPSGRVASAAEVAAQLAPWAAEADLGKLLHRAIQVDSPEPVPIRSRAWLGPDIGESKKWTAVDAGSQRTWTRWLIACGLLGFLALAGTVFRLTTDFGQLVVETEVDDVTVEVRQGERVVETIEIAAGESEGATKIHSGSYTLVVSGAGDSLRLDKDSVTISRQGVETVRVSRIVSSATMHGLGAEDSLGEGPRHSSAALAPGSKAEATYDGKTYSAWLAELKQERKADRLLEAVKAIVTLGRTDQSEQAARAIIGTMRTHGGIVVDDSMEGKLIQYVANELPKMPEGAFIAAIAQEITGGNRRSREFLYFFFNPGPGRNNTLRNHSNSIADLLLDQANKEDGSWAIEKLVELSSLDKTLPTRRPDVLAVIKRGLVGGELESSTLGGFDPNMHRVIAVEILLQNSSGSIEPDLAERVTRTLDARDPSLRLRVIQAIQKIGREGCFAIPSLLDLLDDEVAANAVFLPRPSPSYGVGGGGFGGGGFGGGGQSNPVVGDAKDKGRVFYGTFPDVRIALLDALAASADASGDAFETTFDRLIQALQNVRRRISDAYPTPAGQNGREFRLSFEDGVVRVMRASQAKAEERLVKLIQAKLGMGNLPQDLMDRLNSEPAAQLSPQ